MNVEETSRASIQTFSDSNIPTFLHLTWHDWPKLQSIQFNWDALEEELKIRAIPFEAKKQLHILYEGRDCGLYEPDLICFGKIIVELKATETVHPKHEAQLLNYLAATGYRLGLLVNFGSEHQVDIRRRTI